MWQIVERDGRWYVTREGEDVGPDDGFGDVHAASAWVAARGAEQMQEGDDADVLRRFAMPVLIPEGADTSDGRAISEGAIEWRDPPLPLMFQTETDVQHFGARLAGTIERVERSGSTISAHGFLHDTDPGRDLGDLLDAQERFGVSADLTEMDADFECVEFDEDGFCEDGVLTITAATVMGATATPFPAFADAYITLDETDEDGEFAVDPETFVVSGEVDLPVADRDTEWDASAAQSAMLDLCTDGDEVDVACLSRGFLFRDPDEDGTAAAHYSLPYADVVNGQLQIVPNGVIAAAAVLSGARGGVEGIPADDRAAIETRVCSLYDRINSVLDLGDDALDCPFDDSAETSTPVLVASGAGSPPSWWFDDPGLDVATALTVEDDGRVYGHLATWGTCHIGYDGVCVTPPRSEASYAYFRTGEVRCDDCGGKTIPVGTLTYDTGHAGERLSADAARRHYDDTGTAWADVAIGEDDVGVWVAGAARPSVLSDDETLRTVRASALSGDWRRIGGNLELVAALAVNVPGFPIPRSVAASAARTAGLTPRAHVDDGRQVSLVASGVVLSDDQADAGDLIRDGARLARVERWIAAREAETLADDVDPSREATIARLDAQVHL